jgi:phytoene dehydrogenase-like protein
VRSPDVVVVGGGHNSLVAAATLARAGRRVRLFERSPRLGGTVATVELGDGFRAPVFFPSVELFHPSLRRELELESHGLRLLRPRGGTLVLRGDGRPLHLGGSGGGIEGDLSIADAAGLGDFAAFLARLSRVLEPLFVRPLPELDGAGLGTAFELLRHAVRLRRLGRRDVAAALRFLPMPIADVLDERFEDAGLEGALAAAAVTASWLGPKGAGTAFGLLYHRPAWSGGLLARPVFAEGGPGALVDALAAAARKAGAELETETAVEEIVVRNGKVRGVRTSRGEEVDAPIVVSGLDPRRTLLELADPAWLDPEEVQLLSTARGRGTASIVTYAVESLPEPAAGATIDLSGRVLLDPTLESLERAFDANKYGEIPERPSIELTVPTLSDPTLAPPGKHVVCAWVQYTPAKLARGSWEEESTTLAERVTDLIGEHLPGFDERVLHRSVVTPADLEACYGMLGGCPYHLEMALDQMLFLRPIPRWSRHRTPIEGLFLCGPGTHPGGGVTGLPGRNAARVVLDG